ncbi:MAG: hypothetical protein NTZ69_06135, partial [Bacteroidia bacterium]|nr:hypothetical protein [Bacteroidia bacterium]
SLKTGTYLLAVSNRINPNITFKELFVCNRFTGLSESATVLASSGIVPYNDKQVAVQTEGLEKNYNTRSTAKITLKLVPEMLSLVKDNLMVSVAETTQGVNSISFCKALKAKNSQMTEKEGVVLDGSLKDLASGAPFNNGCVFLSVPDSVPVLQYFFTGEDGRFHFQLDDYQGRIPVVVQGFDPAKKRLVKVIPDRRDSPDCLPTFEARTVPDEIQRGVKSAMDATTLRKIFGFQEVIVPLSLSQKERDYPFFGVPTETVRPILFIDLPDFTEVSRELLLGVKFRAYNRIPTMQIFNSATQNYFNDPPLVLLNGIPVQDLNVIKKMGSKDIDRIEICRRERFYGDLAFPGVVAIYSSKQVNKFLPESDELIKLNLDALQPVGYLNKVKEHIQNEPDLRKVLLWEPGIKPRETITLDFETSDIKGSYKVVVRGITRDGEVIYNEQFFEVN